MSAETTDEPEYEPVQVTLDLPGRVVRFYDALTGAGVFLSREEAIRAAVTNSWRFERGSYHSLRLDIDAAKDADEGTETEASGSDGES